MKKVLLLTMMVASSGICSVEENVSWIINGEVWNSRESGWKYGVVYGYVVGYDKGDLEASFAWQNAIQKRPTLLDCEWLKLKWRNEEGLTEEQSTQRLRKLAVSPSPKVSDFDYKTFCGQSIGLRETEARDAKIPPFGKLEQFVKALDQFYSDYKNSKVQIADALEIISAEVRGKDKAYIENLLKHARYSGSGELDKDLNKAAKAFLESQKDVKGKGK